METRSASSYRAYKGLLEVSSLINALQDRGLLLNELMRVAREVMHADACSLMLVDEATGDLVPVVLQSVDEQSAAGLAEVAPTFRVPKGQGIAGWVYANEQPLLVQDAYSDPRFYRQADMNSGYRTRSILCAPLLSGEKCLGVIQVLNPLDREAFEEVDLEPFTAYSQLAGTAIMKLRAIEGERLQLRMERELELASEIQHGFLPSKLPTPEGLEFASKYRPARHVGGDFFDCHACGEGRWFFVVGDVAGKGVPAALLMAKALSFLRLAFSESKSPANTLGDWNRMMSDRSMTGLFVTAVIGVVDLALGKVTLANAGHCPPLFLEASGASTIMDAVPSLPVGILEDAKYGEIEMELGSGEGLLFYTDGLTESQNSTGEFLDAAGVQKLLRSDGALDEILGSIMDGEVAFRGDAEPHDDLTLFALRRAASSR